MFHPVKTAVDMLKKDAIYPTQRDIVREVMAHRPAFVDQMNRIYVLTSEADTNYIKRNLDRSRNASTNNVCMMNVTTSNKRGQKPLMRSIEEESVSLPMVGDVIQLRRYYPDGSLGFLVGEFEVDETISEKRRAACQVVLVARR